MRRPFFFQVMLCWGLSSSLFAQVNGHIRPSATTIHVGDSLLLHVEVSLPSSFTAQWVIPDSMPHWEWLARPQPKAVQTAGGRSYAFELRLTSYDTGYWPIPPLALTLGRQVIRFDTLHIRVCYANADHLASFKDMKPLVDVPEESSHSTAWFSLLGMLLFLGLMVFFYLRRKRLSPTGGTPAEREALSFRERVEQLEKDFLKRQLTDKELYQRWISLLQELLSSNPPHPNLYMNDQLLREKISGLPLPGQVLQQMQDSLAVAERVRFACFKPEPNMNTIAMRALHATVANVEQKN